MKCAENSAAARASWIIRATAAVIVASATSAVQAQVFWDSSGPDQNWLTTQNWESSLGGDQQPGFADTAILNNGGTIVIDRDGPVAGAFLVGRAADTSISPYNTGLGGTVNFQAGSLVSGSTIPAVDVGVDPLAAGGAAVWNHNGGTLRTGELFRIGVGVGATGTLNMSGGLIDVATSATSGLDFFLVGDNGNATMNMTGGEVRSRGLFGIALQPASTGTLTISSGSITTNDVFTIGERGTGTANLNGGTLTSRLNFVIGGFANSHGTLNMSGGTITMTDPESDFVVGWRHDQANGVGANGVLNQTGGDIIVPDNYTMAIDAFSKGTTVQSGGTLVADQLLVGERGTGDYTLNGNGTIDLNETMSIATFVSIFAPGAFRNAAGTFTQSGNTSVTVGGMAIGESGTGTYTINSGSLHVLGVARNGGSLPDATFKNVLIGRDGGFERLGTGRMVQNGGTVTIDTNIYLGDFDDSNGTYEISGGSLSVAGNVNVGAALATNAPPDATRTGTQGQAASARGTFLVRGSAATINIGGNFLANPGDKTRTTTGAAGVPAANSATLAFQLTNGISRINVAGVGDLDGAVIDMGFEPTSTFVPAYNQTFDLMTVSSFGSTGTGTTQNTGTGMNFALAAGDATDWLLQVVAGGNGQILQAVNRVAPGDTNADKIVNFTDLVKLAQNYNTQSTAGRTVGDFNRDGVVNFSDLVTLAQNYNKNFTGQLSQLPQFASAEFQADWALAQSLAVPEPTTLGLLGGAGMLVLGRRRKASR